MPLAAWNIYTGITYYDYKVATTRSLETFLSAYFRFLTFINIGSTCVIYAVTSRVFRYELWTLFKCPWYKIITRQQQRPLHIFTISRRIAPA